MGKLRIQITLQPKSFFCVFYFIWFVVEMVDRVVFNIFRL